MVRCVARWRLLRETLVCATLVSGLVGCGGGGGGASPPPGGGNGGVDPGPESARLLAEFVARDANNQFVHVWDPAHPGVAIQDVRITESNGIVWTASHLSFSDATQYDASTRTLTTLGHAKVFFDNDGKLYSIDLRGGQSHVPVQLSNAVDVFTTVKVFPISADGVDAWIDVQGGASDWAIRTAMTATDAPVAVRQIAAPLRDPASGLPQYFFAALGSASGNHFVPTTFEVTDAGFQRLAVAAVDAMDASDHWLGVDPAQAGVAYVAISGQLHALHWSDAGVTVDATGVVAFTQPGSFAPAVADGQALYVNDGAALLAISNSAVRNVGTFTGLPAALVDAGSYVAASETVTLTSTHATSKIETLRKTDGTLALIEDDATDMQLLGANDEFLVIAGTPEFGQAFLLASGDGSIRSGVGSQFVGLVRAAGGRIDQPAPAVALLSCVAGSATGFCGAGPLTQQDMAGANTTAIGTVAASSAWMRGDVIAGMATALSGQNFLLSLGGFGEEETNLRDAWQLTPGTAGSLQRVTANLP